MGLEVYPEVWSLCVDGTILCDGRLQGSTRPPRALCGLSLQWSSQVSHLRKIDVEEKNLPFLETGFALEDHAAVGQ